MNSLKSISSSSQSSLQSSSTGETVASLINASHLSWLFDDKGIDKKTKKIIDQKTIESLAKCESYGDNFTFHTIQLYARPIQEIGTHNTDNNDNDDNKNNAYKASQGYHHGLVILTHHGEYEAIRYVLDRVEGVRFIKVNVIESELKEGHLLLIKEYNNIKITYSTIKPFIQSEAKQIYNVVNNNCLHFAYKFIDEIIKQNEWNNNFSAFWAFIRKQFKPKDIQKGKYNEQQNDYVKELNENKLLLHNKIKLIKEQQARSQWKVGDEVLVKLDHFKGVKSWVIGVIYNIHDNDTKYIYVKYREIGEIKKEKINRYNRDAIKPYIKIPSNYFDPITKKLMTEPVQILRSGVIYDAVTVQYLQHLSSNIDPITGVLISTGKAKPIVIRKKKLKKRIEKFMEKYHIDDELINCFKAVNDKKLWKDVYQELTDKYDVKLQQKQINKQSMVIFYPENESNVVEEEENSDESSECDEDDEDEEDEKKNDNDDTNDNDDDEGVEDNDLLKWNSDVMFINHTSIPIITCMGPSRIGKSFLMNELLKDKAPEKEIFETSDLGNTAKTKGAWISVYGNIDNQNDAKNNDDDFIFMDQMPEDDVEMWSTEDIISWFKSLNPKFVEICSELIEYIKNNNIDGNTFYKLNDVNLLNKTLKMKRNDASSLAKIVYKRLHHKTDEIDINKVNQMYLVDMEGLSHGVTDFTIKLFEGCYAISNVVIWYDIQVMSDSFKKLMQKLKKKMQVIVNSNRKPAFLYLLRNGDQVNFDFDIDEDDEEDEDNDKYVDDFDEWINKHPSCKWLRDMNVFSSINGYLLDSPIFPKRQKRQKRKGKKKDDNNKSNQQKLYYQQDTLNELMDKIKSISHKTARFANNLDILNDQINNINKDSELSLEKRMAACNSKLKWFLLNNKDKEKKKLQIQNAIITFNKDKELVTKIFAEGLSSLEKQLKFKNSTIKSKFRKELIQNKEEIINQIWWDKTSLAGGIFVATALFLFIGVTTGSLGTTYFMAFAPGAITKLVPEILYDDKPIKITENDLSELEFYE